MHFGQTPLSALFPVVLIATCLLVVPGHAQSDSLPFKTVADVPLTGRASRFDYQSLDEQNGRLYIAHLGDDMVTVFDTRARKVITDIKDLKHVHGVIAVPALHRIFASATGTNELAVIDDRSFEVIARVPTGDYPDGIAYAAKEKKIYVSNKDGKSNTVIDAVTNRPIATVPLGGPVGNSQYDPASDRIFVAVHKLNEIVEIDPETDKVIGRYPLPGCRDSHGLLIDGDARLAFAACEGNGKLAVLDLNSKKLRGLYPVGDGPDVLAFDKGLKRLYVSSESGVVSVFDEAADTRTGEAWRASRRAFYAPNAHSVATDSSEHLVYFPLENLGGKPILRIAAADK